MPVLIIILVAAWTAVSFRLARRIRQARGGKYFPPVSYRRATLQLAAYVMVFVFNLGLVCAQLRQLPHLLWGNVVLLFIWLPLLIAYARQFQEIRLASLKEESHRHHGPLPPKKPTFFWQGILIVLPVLLMTAFGLWAILRERNAVEQEARQRATAIIGSLPVDFDRLAANRLTQFDAAKNAWFSYLVAVQAAWPENKNRLQWLADTNLNWSLSNNVAVLHRAFPGWRDEPPLLLEFLINTNGEIPYTHPLPARPPEWVRELSPDQKELLEEMKRPVPYGSRGEVTQMMFLAFRGTSPPPGPLAMMEYLFLLAKLNLYSQSASNKVALCLQFSGRYYDVDSDSGVPLRTLALAEALKYARQSSGPSAVLWEKLVEEASHPTSLTTRLLAEVGPLTSGNSKLKSALAALQLLAAQVSTQQEFAEAVRQTGKINGITTTNFWLDALDRRWFCITGPGTTTTGTSISNHPVWITNIYTQVSAYPKSVVALGFADTLADAKISWPDYFGISLELAGEPVNLPSPWGKTRDGKPVGEVLAETTIHLRQPAMLRSVNPVSGQSENTMFEVMPSHPPFTLRIYLADRNLLYAEQRQRQLIFGLLIAFAGIAALTGFVTARRSFLRQQQLNEMKSNFVSSVSHELRAPIASVRLLAESLERGKISEPGKQKEYFGFIVQECRRLSSLIENILDFSRIEQGRKQYEFEPTDLIRLTQQTVGLLAAVAADRQVLLEMDLPAEPVTVLADGKALQQALVNLLDNALKHSPPGATIRVGLAVSPAAFQLWVEDQGDGIPAAEHQKIFERFYRRGSELRRETEGVGIGLSIVKHILEAHQGTVQVRSAVGQGSRFTLILPRNQTEEAQAGV